MRRHWLHQPVHSSWMLAIWCLGVVLGVCAVVHLPAGYVTGGIWSAVGIVLLLVCFWRAQMVMVPVVLIAGVLFGLWRGSVGQPAAGLYEEWLGRTVHVRGVVSEDPDIDKHNQTVLRLGEVAVNGRTSVGKVWVVVSQQETAIWRSDRVDVSGILSKGFGPFNASIYRAHINQVERSQPGDVAVAVRQWFAGRVGSKLSSEATALGMGYLTGLRRALPPELIDALTITGLTHVVVASGYNLTILIRLCRRLFARASKYLATITSLAMIFGFMAMTGASPSMSRASLVAGLSLATWYVGRTIHPLVLLPIAAATTLLVNPQYGWNDLGWQLSFAAFAGVIIVAPLLQRYFFGDKPPGVWRQVLGETVSAQLMTMPLLIVAFGFISNISLLANLLIVPLVPLAMLLVFLTGLTASLPLLGWLIAQPTQWLLDYMIFVIKSLAHQPWATTELVMNSSWLVIVYAFIALGTYYLMRKTKYRLRESNIVE